MTLKYYLKVIYLSDNQINAVEASMFSGLDRLQVIELALNKIKYIYPKLFQGLKSLQIIDFTYNSISAIETKTFKDLPSLGYLKIACNPILTIDGQLLGNYRNVDFTDGSNVYPVEAVAEELCKRLPPHLNIFIGFQDYEQFL